MKKNITKNLFTRVVRGALHRCALLALTAIAITSCSWFDNDVNEFMEKYTETAGVLEHTMSVETYKDANDLDCINSKKSVTLNLLMRNPKKFDLIPSVDFPQISSSVSREGVTIEQISFDELVMYIPFEFLQKADEGGDISPEVLLYEPMSGRYFEAYTFQLSCNSVPPQLLNPTVINNNGESFVLAFDMPSAEELSLRHKDLASITINNIEYAVSINADGTFSFTDPRFHTEPAETYIFLSGKTFKHSDRSVYFDTGDVFTEGDKEYELILKDKAGLTASSYASTTITRLLPPTVLDFDDIELEDGCNDIVPGNEEDPYRFSINPAVGDYEGNTVEGTTLHYALYKGTSTVAEVQAEGESDETVKFNLSEGTYYLEVFSTKTSYEQSNTAVFNLRVVDNAIYVSENGSDETGDGTKDLQFASVRAALEDLGNRGLDGSDFYIYITGTIHESVNVNTTAAKSLTITKRPSAESAVFDAQGAGSVLVLSNSTPVILKNITLTGGKAENGGAVRLVSGASLTIGTGAVLTENTATNYGGAVYGNSGASIKISDGAKITGNSAAKAGGGILADGSISISGGIDITGNTITGTTKDSNLCLGQSTVIVITGELKGNSGSSKIGISTLATPTVLTPIQITRNYGFFDGYNKDVIPGTYFIGDTHGITYNETTGEAFISINTGNLNDSLSVQRITFPAISADSFEVGAADATKRTITITPKVEAMGAEGFEDITEQALADTSNPITWNLQLLIGGKPISGASSSTLSITIPQNVTYKDYYMLLVQAVYNGVTYDAEFTIEGR